MSKITDFTTTPKAVYDALRKDIEAALAGVGTKYNVKLSAGKINYSHEYADIKITASVITADGMVVTKDAANFKQYADMFGLKPEDLGRIFIDHGIEYQITGLLPNSRKKPVTLLRLHDNQKQIGSAEFVKICLQRNAATPTAKAKK